MKHTRQQYLNNECTHREYYAQFVTPDYIEYVVSRIGAKEIMETTGEHLNSISLKKWDMLNAPNCKQQLIEAGDNLTLAGKVCMAKEAARQFIENNK